MVQNPSREESGHGFRTLFRAIRPSLAKPETWTWLFVAIGVVLRVAEYTDNRPLYMDERALLVNLDLPIFDFITPLAEFQLAPPGFLVVERAMVRLPTPRVMTARLIPFLCGIASMFLMRAVARRYLSPSAIPVAVGLFALDDWLLYYSTELKQYSSDIVFTLVTLWLVADREVMTRQRLLVLVAFGMVGVWFSHPLALVLGAVGTCLIVEAAMRHDWKKTGALVLMSVLWAVSFAICYHVSHRILSKERFIWDWWAFAFLPIPPRSLAEGVQTFWQVLNILNSPAGVLTPLGVLGSAFLALALYVLGARSLGQRWRGGPFLLLSPVFITLVASALHQYPFHGRLLLFLVPTIHLLVAEGAAALARPGGAILTTALAAFLLIQPAGDVVWNRMIIHRYHGADSHGDLLPDLLDYLETPTIDNPSTRSPAQR